MGRINMVLTDATEKKLRKHMIDKGYKTFEQAIVALLAATKKDKGDTNEK